MRPTLKEQLVQQKITEDTWKLTDKECINLLCGGTFWGRMDFLVYRKAELLWRIIHWNWFDVLKETEKENKKQSGNKE